MAQASVLSKVPLLRVFIPFATGIIAAEFQHSILIAVLLMIIGIALYVYLYLRSLHSIEQKERLRQWAIIPIALTFVGLGNVHSLLNQPESLDVNDLNGKMAISRIDELRYTDYSCAMTTTLLQVNDSCTPPAKVLLSTRGCDYTLAVGDLIAFKTDLKPIRNQGNPYETDYARLQRDKGILYSQHLRLSQMQKTGHQETLHNKITQWRTKLEERIINSRLNPDTQSFLIALLMGDATHIDRETRYEYSCAGIAHILALSGLHVGIVTLIIWFLLYPLDYLRLKKLRLGITLLSLIAFAVLTGLSASVIRATIMTAFVFIGYVLFTKSSPLNSLAAAAIVILLMTPNALMNVGFQLSFITVASIIVFMPQEGNKNRKKQNHVWVYVKSSIIISLIAMLSTVMLTAYYFHTISFASVVSNLLVLPLLTVIMACGALFFLLLLAGIEIEVLNSFINWLFSAINYIVDLINGVGASHVDNVYVTFTDVVIYYIMIALLGCAWKLKSRIHAIAGLAMLAVGILAQAYQTATLPQHGMAVLNDFSNTPVFFFENQQGYLWIPDADTVDIDKFKQHYVGMLAHQRIDSIQVIDHTGLELPWAYVKPPYAMIDNLRFVAMGNKRDPSYAAEELPTVDLAIVTKRCHATASQVSERYPTATLILSGGIYRPDHDILVNECDTAHINYYSVVNSGAWVKTYE